MNHYDFSVFREDLKDFSITADQKQLDQLARYFELLVEWNSVMNLTAITAWDEVVKKHFTDSLSIVKAMPELINKKCNMIDVGTGAGFPGIPIKIMFSGIQVTLLDSLNKRVNFLSEVINKLELKNIEVIHGRAEDFAKPDKLRESFDVCVSRAVANLTILSEYCLPFVKVGGVFVSYKSEKTEDELKEAEEAIKVLGGKFLKQVPFYLPSSDLFRNIVIIDKIKVTPGKFPRKAGQAAKEPIH